MQSSQLILTGVLSIARTYDCPLLHRGIVPYRVSGSNHTKTYGTLYTLPLSDTYRQAVSANSSSLSGEALRYQVMIVRATFPKRVSTGKRDIICKSLRIHSVASTLPNVPSRIRQLYPLEAVLKFG